MRLKELKMYNGADLKNVEKRNNMFLVLVFNQNNELNIPFMSVTEG